MRASLPGTGTSATFQARLHAFIPPSRESACIPRACSCCAAARLVFPAPQTVTTGMSPGNFTPASAWGSLVCRASYASMWKLPGMAHSIRSCTGRISSTVIGCPSSSHVLKVSTSIVSISVLLFRSRPVAPEASSPEALVRACVRCTHWYAEARQPHLQRRNRDHGNRPQSPCPEGAQGGEPPDQLQEWKEHREDVRQNILQRVAHQAG